MHMRVNTRDESLVAVSKALNRIACLSCWLAILLTAIYFVITANYVKTFLLLQYTPLRYFLFDISDKKKKRRPPSLDRTIPLNIFIHYLGRRFDIPQGGIIADICGVLVATVRMDINGFGLLWLDSFSLFFSVKDTSTIPLDDDITLLSHSNRIGELRAAAEQTTSEEKTQHY